MDEGRVQVPMLAMFFDTGIHYYKDDTSCLIDRQVPIYERSFPH